MKRFTIQTTFKHAKKKAYPFYVYVGNGVSPFLWDPIGFQSLWLKVFREGKISEDIVLSFQRVLQIARHNKANFEDLAVAALSEEKKTGKRQTKNITVKLEKAAKKLSGRELWQSHRKWIRSLVEPKAANYAKAHKEPIKITDNLSIPFAQIETIATNFATQVIKPNSLIADKAQALLKHAVIAALIAPSSGAERISTLFFNDHMENNDNPHETFLYNIAIILDVKANPLPTETEAVLTDYFFLYHSGEAIYEHVKESLIAWCKKPSSGKDKVIKEFWKTLNTPKPKKRNKK